MLYGKSMKQQHPKIHPHLAKYIHDIVLSEASAIGEMTKWKEELLRKILLDVTSDMSCVHNQEELAEQIEKHKTVLQQEMEEILNFACLVVGQLPTEILKRYNRQ